MPFLFMPNNTPADKTSQLQQSGSSRQIFGCRWCGLQLANPTSVGVHEDQCKRNVVAPEDEEALENNEDLDGDKMGKLYYCDQCEAPFRHPQTLSRHVNKFHGGTGGGPVGAAGSPRVRPVNREKTDSTSNIRCLEPGCGVVFNRLFNLTKHLQDFHGLDFQEEIYEFDNYAAVEEFRYNKEIENQISFINFCGSRRNRLSDGREYLLDYLFCNRSGKKATIDSSKRRRHPKRTGSKKLDSFCTAFMKIKRDVLSGKTTVTACFQHYGHDIELCHLRLPRQDRVRIAQELLRGTQPEAILEDCRNLADSEPASSKLSQLTRQDLTNIMREFGIKDVYDEYKKKVMRAEAEGMRRNYMQPEPSDVVLDENQVGSSEGGVDVGGYLVDWPPPTEPDEDEYEVEISEKEAEVPQDSGATFFASPQQ